VDPWSWLLAPCGEGWRAAESRGNPAHDPRFVLLRRTLKGPKDLLASLIAGIAAADPNALLRWRHRRRAGDGHDSLLFSISATDPERFVFAIETLDSEQLALWFFSGFVEPNELSSGYFEDHETQGRVPRLVLRADHGFPLERWLREAMEGTLRFSWESELGAVETGSVVKDQSCIVSAVFVEAEQGKREAVLIVCERGAHRIVRLEPGRYSLGRDPRCEVVLKDPAVSARHAVLEISAESSLTDLGAHNPSLVNGAPIGPRGVKPLGPLAALRLGSQDLLFRTDGRAPADDLNILQSWAEKAALTSGSLERVRAQASASELSAGEQLVLEGLLTPEEWARLCGVEGAWQGAQSYKPWIIGLLASLLAILAAIAILLGDLVYDP
jgi:hypothetical protein